MGTNKKEPLRMRIAVNLFLFSLGLIFLLFIASTIVMLLAPQYFNLCIFEKNCGGIDSDEMDCDISDPSDPCNNSTNIACSSNVWDANNMCCESGQVDVCGICDGTTTSIDRDGLCCSGAIDASGACCYEEVNPWGVCGEQILNGTIAFEANVTSEFSGVLGLLLSSMSNLDEGQIVFLEGENGETISDAISQNRRLLSDEHCSGDDELCATAKSLYSPSSSPSSWSSGSFIIKPVSSTDEEPKSTISLDEINALLEKLSKCFCNSIAQISNAQPISSCGNKQCEDSETCSSTEDEDCCIEDCPIILKTCGFYNSKECNGNGLCASTTGVCKCWEGYSGDSCETCSDGYTLNQPTNKCLKIISLGLNKTDITTWSTNKNQDKEPNQSPPPTSSQPLVPTPKNSSLPPAPAPSLEPAPAPVPPIMWREVGKLYRDLTFAHGPSLSFGIEFNPVTHQVYLGFQDLGELNEVPKPTIVRFDGKNWELVGARGGLCEVGSRPRPDVRFYFDYKIKVIDGKEKIFAGSFDLSGHDARTYEYNEDEGAWVKNTNFFVHYYEIMAYSGSILVWDDGDYPIFSMPDELKQVTHILQYNYDDQTWKNLQFGPNISNRRKYAFMRNRYNNQLYISGCDNLYQVEMYPRVYRFEEFTNKWENITKPNDTPNPNEWECRFSALAFDGYGNPVTAHISTKNDQQSVVIMVYNEHSEEWNQVTEIGVPDLPGAESHFKVFWDGARFSMDNEGNIYLYFRSHFFSGKTWPVIDILARLWVIVFDKINLQNWSIWDHDFKAMPGIFPLEEITPNADSTLGHLTFDPKGIPYYAFCQDSFRVTPLCMGSSTAYKYCGTYVQYRCTPTVYRKWHW